MSQKDLINELLKSHNGTITASDAREAGVTYKTLQRMNLSGELEKLGHGLYMDPDRFEDIYLLTQYRCKKGIYSHETALYFNDLTDRTPLQLMMTIPSGYNSRLLQNKEDYQFFYVSESLHQLGRIDIQTPFGNTVSIYDSERTICDCLKMKDHLDADLVIEAVRRYFSTPGPDYTKLLFYAEKLKVKSTIRNYMEVLT